MTGGFLYILSRRRKLVMKTDDNGKLCEASINWQMPNFDKLLQRGIGNDWSLFVTDLMYMMYSSKRYTNEIEALRLRFVIDDSFPTIHVTFSNFIVVYLKVPEQYPRVGFIVVVDCRHWRRSKSKESILSILTGVLYIIWR